MTDEVTDIGSRGLRKLCGEMDYDDWAMAAQARLGKRGLWDVITGPRPARRELAVSEDERELELKRRIAQRAFEQSQKDQGIHSWGDGPLPVTLLGPVPGLEFQWRRRILALEVGVQWRRWPCFCV